MRIFFILINGHGEQPLNVSYCSYLCMLLWPASIHFLTRLWSVVFGVKWKASQFNFSSARSFAGTEERFLALCAKLNLLCEPADPEHLQPSSPNQRVAHGPAVTLQFPLTYCLLVLEVWLQATIHQHRSICTCSQFNDPQGVAQTCLWISLCELHYSSRTNTSSRLFCLYIWTLIWLSKHLTDCFSVQLYAGAILEVCGWKLGRFPQVQGESSAGALLMVIQLFRNNTSWNKAFECTSGYFYMHHFL